MESSSSASSAPQDPIAAVRARLGVCRLVSSSPQVMQDQARALVDELSSCKLSEEQAQELKQLGAQIPWQPCQSWAIGHAIEAAVHKKRPRRSMQDYVALPEYLLAEEWQHLEAHDSTLDSRLNVLLQRVLKLGGRTLDEHSLKRVTCILLLTSETPQRLLLMSPGQKQDMNNYVKQEFKKLVRFAETAAEHLQTLPLQPSGLSAELFNKAYAEGQRPTACPPAFVERLLAAERTFRCRGPGAASEAHRSSPAPLQIDSAQPMERFASMLVQGMGQMHMQIQALQAASQAASEAGLYKPASEAELLRSQLQLRSPLQSRAAQLQSSPQSPLQLQGPAQSPMQLHGPAQRQLQLPLQSSPQLAEFQASCRRTA